MAWPYGADVGVGALGSARGGFEKQRQHPTSVPLLATKRQGGEIALPNFASFAGALRARCYHRRTAESPRPQLHRGDVVCASRPARIGSWQFFALLRAWSGWGPAAGSATVRHCPAGSPSPVWPTNPARSGNPRPADLPRRTVYLLESELRARRQESVNVLHTIGATAAKK